MCCGNIIMMSFWATHGRSSLAFISCAVGALPGRKGAGAKVAQRGPICVHVVLTLSYNY